MPQMTPPVHTYIRSLRQERGVRAADLAAELGIDVTSLRRYETGVRKVRATTLWRIAQALDVPITALYGEQESIRQQAA